MLTRYPDADCRFTIVSLKQDSGDVGELNKYREMDVNIRGVVEPMHGRAGMVLSHVRQFYGGPPKFKPNPRLVHGFQGDAERPAVNDPNLRAQAGHRAFINSRDQEPVRRGRQDSSSTWKVPLKDGCVRGILKVDSGVEYWVLFDVNVKSWTFFARSRPIRLEPAPFERTSQNGNRRAHTLTSRRGQSVPT